MYAVKKNSSYTSFRIYKNWGPDPDRNVGGAGPYVCPPSVSAITMPFYGVSLPNRTLWTPLVRSVAIWTVFVLLRPAEKSGTAFRTRTVENEKKYHFSEFGRPKIWGVWTLPNPALVYCTRDIFTRGAEPGRRWGTMENGRLERDGSSEDDVLLDFRNYFLCGSALTLLIGR